MTSLLEVITEIKRRPLLYIGDRSIASLKTYLDGWINGYISAGGAVPDVEMLNGFQDWIQAYYQVTSTQSWAQIIQFNSTDGLDAFERFFSRFEDYMRSRESRAETEASNS